MRTVCTDILMICKGWGTETSHSREEALKDYIGLFTGCDSRDISDNTVLHFLSHSVKKFIDSNRLVDALNNNAESYLYRDMPIVPFLTKLYINLLIDRIATDLDLSDYEDITEYCKRKGEYETLSKYFPSKNKAEYEPWWRHFKEYNVEDDRK